MLKSLKIYYTLLFCLGLFSFAKATHNRAGEITYRWVGPGLYTYEIKVTTYTNLLAIGGQSPADRCQDTVYFGDGTSAVVNRSNGPCNGGCSPQACEGQPISSSIKLNEYITTHQYQGPGNYRISMEDPNRNAGVENIPNSVNQVFYIESYLVIPMGFSGSLKNNSPVLTFPPIDNACAGKCFFHNPGAYDIDGDSLSYELTTCRGHLGQTCPGYTHPAAGIGGTYDVNPLTGTLTWCVPQKLGEFNLAMIIKEWRKNFDGVYYMVGYILRDLQVEVGSCSNNPPSIQPITDTCVVAGSTITKIIRANDSDLDVVTLSANGGPFGVSSSPATFNSSPTLSNVTGTFQWLTDCSHIRKASYQVTIKAEDSDPQINLVDFKTFNIRVVAPAPQNFVAVPQGTNIKLTWNKPACSPTTGNKIERYCIYRKTDCTPWAHNNCETGVPASSGFTKIGCTTSLGDTTFLDTNDGKGLTQGTNYSYLVVAVFTDGSESYASNRVCVQLKRDVPILVNVDVQSTATSSGSVFVRWVKPLLGPNALDTISIPGPYEFRLMHHNGFIGTFTQVYSVTKPYFLSINQLSDTTFIHNGINTQDNANTYKIEFYANGQFIGAGQKASSVFLSLTPSDNTISLSWQHQVPWGNYKYYISRKDPGQTTYTVIGNTTNKTFVNTGLVNGVTYCFKVQSEGQYSDPTIFSPLLNFSQEVCDKPKDMTAPCSPTLNIISDCAMPSVVLQWNNPNHVCSDDAIKYNLYFAETDNVDLVFTSSINNINDTVLAFDNLTSIAGCYAVTAVDSFGNESLQSAKMCVDNCPEYELPNVITINGDSVNDYFKPIKNRFIKNIDLKIYNRWGTVVYETNDPVIMWDGKVMESKQLCSEGTYFYICQVNEIRVTGIKERFLRGFIQVFHK